MRILTFILSIIGFVAASKIVQNGGSFYELSLLALGLISVLYVVDFGRKRLMGYNVIDSLNPFLREL